MFPSPGSVDDRARPITVPIRTAMGLLFEHLLLRYDIIRCSTAFAKGKRYKYERLNG